MKKICKKCGLEKNISEFYRHRFNKDGLKGSCKECLNKYTYTYIKTHRKPRIPKHPGKVRSKEYQRSVLLKRQYGMTIANYNELFKIQDGCCAICKKHQTEMKKILAVDHDHNTGKIRGLLCYLCNQAIGMLKDNPEIIESAKNYILKNK